MIAQDNLHVEKEINAIEKQSVKAHIAVSCARKNDFELRSEIMNAHMTKGIGIKPVVFGCIDKD